MRKNKNNRHWITEYHKDLFVKKAKETGYRSRSAYKLLEINQRDQLFQRGDTVVDLGAAPGGWSQVAKGQIGKEGRVIAIDIRPIKPLPGVVSLEGDMRNEEIQNQIAKLLAGNLARVVISDMAPNISGSNAIDQPRALQIAESALELSIRFLAPGGDFLVKVFQGEGFDGFVNRVQRSFSKTRIRKPKASRASSREVYVLGWGYRQAHNCV
uniref:Ribosomal RNA large subunit methyltransferase E n=1 Tax=Candidatus Kentrum sp. TUN TaxID=2126343 RepID=A0A450ZDI8_9GAMM|nr:MAG: 23S rRNA Um-2552 2'-O-methyltransferase [Candidatus Kentron sp. TUN]VFK53454.1 MAG: 23S rRNA Um-2552 2'-O-methyltransferase [Candidatus Kentron sp. TUN]VFK54670.1 MAG: 23S rRNA Um-2552 2'-O-methyltransferase [Candidatus Kentron sp. TUN]